MTLTRRQALKGIAATVGMAAGAGVANAAKPADRITLYPPAEAPITVLHRTTPEGEAELASLVEAFGEKPYRITDEDLDVATETLFTATRRGRLRTETLSVESLECAIREMEEHCRPARRFRLVPLSELSEK